MHMADALLSPAVGGAMLAVSGGLLVYSARRIRQNFAEKRIPLMGVAGAFVFAAQMVNFAIPGTGSSGHIAGSVLLAALLGSAPAFVVLAGVLLIQALFFADGGLLAWGCNLFNMGFFGCFLSVPYLFRPIAGDCRSKPRVFLAAVVASVAALELGAFSVTLATTVSGVTALPFATFAATMLAIHLPIALIEGAATGAVLLFVRRNLPDADALRIKEQPYSIARLSWVFGLAALVVGGGLSLAASEAPDGLEWSLSRLVPEGLADAPDRAHQICAAIGKWFAVLPDYAFSVGESRLGTIVSGVVGAAVCALFLAGLLTLLHKKPTEKSR